MNKYLCIGFTIVILSTQGYAQIFSQENFDDRDVKECTEFIKNNYTLAKTKIAVKGVAESKLLGADDLQVVASFDQENTSVQVANVKKLFVEYLFANNPSITMVTNRDHWIVLEADFLYPWLVYFFTYDVEKEKTMCSCQWEPSQENGDDKFFCNSTRLKTLENKSNKKKRAEF